MESPKFMLPLPQSFPPPGGSDGSIAPAMTPAQCRLCESTFVRRKVLPDGSAWCECNICGLTFVIPRDAQRDPVSVYSLAYAGRLQEAGLRDFFVKLVMRSDADAAGVPAWKMLNSAHRASVRVMPNLAAAVGVGLRELAPESLGAADDDDAAVSHSLSPFVR